MKQKIFAWVKAHKIISAAVVVVLAIGIFFMVSAGSGSPTQYVVGTVTKGDLVITVNGTGQVEAENQVDLKPQGTTQSASTITEVDVKQGDKVVKGEQIAVINNSSALTQLAQAKANLESAQANYNKVAAGATSQSVAVSQSQVSSAQISLQNAEQTLVNRISSAYNDAFSVVFTNTNNLFTNPQSSNPQFSVSGGTMTDSQLQISISNERLTSQGMFSSWKSQINKLDSSTGNINASDLATALATTNTNLSSLNQLLNDILNALTNDVLPASAGTSYISEINSSRTTISSDISNVLSAKQSVQSASSTLAQNQASYSQTTAPVLSEDLQTAQAQVDNDKAALQAAQNTYNESFITAPFSGTIAAVDVSVGDAADTNTVIATIITPEQIAKISLNEVDAAQVKIGDIATITFNALPGVTATGTVSQIDTIGTVTQGVVSYSAKIVFDAADQGVKPGMSVSATVATGKDTAVLLVPNSAVLSVGSNSTVQVLDGVTGAKDGATISLTTAPHSVTVQIGDSDNSNTVITSGLTEGELIVTHTVTGATKTSSGGLFGGGA
ncbi:MAG: efflux RND transporter periplasmic adaptor subunit [Candidatus Pacebacteria bacterium]|nr:efflux RND transporter periplasmic adaptor subunit [Candidatus Paceibacterota bacterium]